MKITKGHYVPKELITSEAVHEAVVKCFVAAGFRDVRPDLGDYKFMSCIHFGVAIGESGRIHLCSSTNKKEPLTLQQLFTAENGLQWPDWAEHIQRGDDGVFFTSANKGVIQFISGSFYQAESVVLATRQLKEREVENEALDNLIVKLSGVTPPYGGTYSVFEPGDVVIYCKKSKVERGGGAWTAGNYYSGGKSFNPEGFNLVCEVVEFERRAKELGYINGYRWGIEYPINGKRPDLESGVQVDCDWYDGATIHNIASGLVDWSDKKSFRITDPRYKPAGEANANAPTHPQSLTHSEGGLTHSEWWDYENDKRVATPPVGEKLLFDDSGVMTESVILYIGKEKMLATIAGGSDTEYCMGVASLDFYYPLDHATRKDELERKAFVDDAFCLISDVVTDTDQALAAARRIVNDGWRPTK